MVYNKEIPHNRVRARGKEGKGKIKLGSGAFEGTYSFGSRFEEEPGTNPEELIAAAHAGCFSMALSSLLTEAGFPPKSVATDAKVFLKAGPVISQIDLTTVGDVPGISEAEFLKLAEDAKRWQRSKSTCPQNWLHSHSSPNRL